MDVIYYSGDDDDDIHSELKEVHYAVLYINQKSKIKVSVYYDMPYLSSSNDMCVYNNIP